MNIYQELGVPTLINAAGTVTRYGGSVMAPAVLDAMREASGEFCKLDDLQEKIGQRIAKILDVQAAYVTSSASAGLALTTAATMAGKNPKRIAQLPDTVGMKSEVIIQKLHRIDYDQAIRLAGATLVEIDDDGRPPVDGMLTAINKNTAALFCMAHCLGEKASVDFESLVSISRETGVPLIVDAASECPPLSALSRFCKAGADLVIFSGGKSLMGPQSTGLIVGRSDLIEACAANGNPFAAIGRPMKVSREEIVGFLTALELYLERDHDKDHDRWESQIQHIAEKLQVFPCVDLIRLTRSETYTVPLLGVRLRGNASFTKSDLIVGLESHQPIVVVSEYVIDDGIVINPHQLEPGQEIVVADRLSTVIRNLT